MGNYASKVIDIALAEVGYLEKKSNKNLDSKTANAGSANYTKYGRDMHEIYPSVMDFPAAWCDAFVDWCFQKAYGISNAKGLLGGNFNDYTVSSAQLYKNKKAYHKTPKVGDQIFFKNSERICHTGLVYKVTSTKVYTVEGNTSGASGVVANGGGVCKKSYNLSYSRIDGYGRPKYDPEPVVEKKIVLEIDGVWGEKTTRRLQQIFGTTVDGKVSNQWKAYKAQNPGLTEGWDWNEKPNGKGSQLIKAMQKWAGLKTQDGEIGPNTIKAFQKKLGRTIIDGKVSNPSSMVKALQKWANNQ